MMHAQGRSRRAERAAAVDDQLFPPDKRRLRRTCAGDMIYAALLRAACACATIS
jgi:hypothetical protein